MKTKQIIKSLRNFDSHFIDNKLATEAANRLEMLSAELKKLHGKLETMKAERNAAMVDVERCCSTCAFSMVNNGTGERCKFCDDCDETFNHWKWRGAKDTNVTSKTATDTNVGTKEED